MQTEIQKKLDLLYQKLAARHFGTVNYSIESIIPLFLQVLNAISINYDTYRKHIPTLLSILEKNDSSSIVLLISTYLDFHNYLIKNENLKKLEISDINDYHADVLPTKFKLALEKSLSKNQKIRISDFYFDSSSLNDFEKEEMVSILYDLIDSSVVKVHWDENTVNDVMFYLPILRSLLKDLKNTKAFHFICGSVMDSFAHSEFYQQSRDFAEELIMASYIDDNYHIGYFNSFRCYSNTSSLIPALLYANLSFSTAIQNINDLTDKYIKEIIWQGIKFFRNVSFHKYVKDIYESIPKHISFHHYEKCGIAHSYFLSLLMVNPEKTPSLVLDFLHENREKIYAGGEVEAMPWLITLYNIKRLCPNADFSSGSLGMYLKTFEYIVPKKMVSSRKAMIEGDSIKLKPLLRNSLVALNETRNLSDLENDNKIAVQIASRLTEDAIIKEDYEGLLLAMMVKADFSFIFSEKEKEEVSKFNIPSKNIESFNKIYGDGSDFMKRLKQHDGFEFIWIINSEEKLFQFHLCDSLFRSGEIKSWDYKNFKKLIETKYFSTFYFEDTIKTTREVRAKYTEEHEEQSKELKEQFLFMKVETLSNDKPILLVLDNRIAVFPHNLYLDNNNNFIFLNRPVCNILSTEWYMKYSNQIKLSKNYSKAIWIPIEGGDFAINQLYSKLEEYLLNFNVSKSVIPEFPLSSELNIITAHGAENIAIKQALYPDNTDIPQINFSSFLGKGKILILFVCHSGSIKSTPFKNSISSIAKKFITKGYQAVIAPFWALHINIPPIWLPVFLKSIEEGNNLVKAIHQANLEVHKIFPTICASHCMHLFGDPHLAIEN